MLKARTLLALVLLPLLIFLVACGDDDDSGDSGGDTPSASASNGDSSAGGSSADDSDDSSADEGDDDSSDDDGDDPSGEEILANCPELLGMFGAFSGGAFANPGTGENPFDDLEALVAVFQNAADNAPGEIQADMQLMADAFAGFYGTLDEFDIDFSNPASFASLSASEQAELQAALESLDTPELQQASDNLDTYFTENCGA